VPLGVKRRHLAIDHGPGCQVLQLPGHLRKFLGLQFAEFVWRTASRRKPSSLISYVMPDIMWRRDAVLASNVHGRFADAT
jgi:hypothetical protein